MTGPTTVCRVGERYPVTLVLSWWLFHQNLKVPPRWYPVMGKLHHDTEFFDLNELHYHVDPRFLDTVTALEVSAQMATEKNGRRGSRQTAKDPWHPAFVEVLSHFPYMGPKGRKLCFTVTDGGTQVKDLDLQPVEEHPREWGVSRIRTRTQSLACQAEMPRALVGMATLNHSFWSLRNGYRGACGDICPHRGYDLRSIPVDALGYRQCPLHQLRVKAPGHQQPPPTD